MIGGNKMKNQKKYQVLLYYQYVQIDNPEEFASAHLTFCKDLDLKGRVIVSHEGINGTVSGTIEQTEQYMKTMNNDPRFADMVFKIDKHNGHTFKKMHVRARKELVTFRLKNDVNPKKTTGEYLSPKEFYEAMQDDNTVILDARNDYEYDVGHFR